MTDGPADSASKPFAKAELVQLFPTCLWIHQVEDHAARDARWLAAIAEIEQAHPMPQGPADAWQSPDDLHRHPAFTDFAGLALTGARNVLGFLKCRVQEIYITSCWANINRRGRAHHDHTHPNNYLSGVYYPKAPKGSGGIVFADPRPQASMIAPEFTQMTPFTSNVHRVEPEAGRMILFHSWLPHSVEANASGEERVSIAFNVMLHGPIGTSMARAQV